jgi:hypothetical protein
MLSIMSSGCCSSQSLCENLNCETTETDEGITIKISGKTKEQTEALKSLYAAQKTLRGNAECCC